MKSRYTELYHEIYNSNKSVGDAVKDAVKKYRLDITEVSFRRMYYAYCARHNMRLPEHHIIPSTPSEPPRMEGQLTKLQKSFNEFDNLVNEFSSDANPLGLPESQEHKYEPYKLPVNHNNILLLNDIHIPYHNIQALTAALKYGLENEVNTILLNGDIIDFYAISRFEKDPRKRNFGHEVLMTRQFLSTLRKLFPRAAIYYKCGNHDVRYDHYIMRNAPDLLGMNEFSFESLMKLDEFNITFIPDKQIIHAGKLTILHGHELGSSVFSPVNIARGLFLRAKDSALCGHHHQASEHSEPNINGKLTTCWSVACLCELHPDYMPINKHHHGFAHIKVMDTGEFDVSNYRIMNGKIR